ncbi:MAG: hypothetical protein C4309_11585, partial [Chloroflexota bacterium]
LLQAWVDDPNSRVILMYTEGLTDGQKFIEVARQVSRVKPIVAVKSGVTQAGTRAVSSHTGSLAGSEQAYRAAFQQAGVRPEDIDFFELHDAFTIMAALSLEACGFAPRGRGVAMALEG